MAGLLDDDFLRNLLGGGASPGGPGYQGAGLLATPSAQPPGLLGGGFRPPANEGLMQSIFGDPRNSADPRGAAMNALAVGLMRGDMASGFEGANRAFADVEDRQAKRLANNLTLTKSALEVQQYQQAQQRAQAIAQERSRLRGPQQFQALPTGQDGFGVPTAGQTPLFSLGTQPGTQPVGGPNLLQPGGMPQQAPQQAPQGFGGGGGGGQEQVYRQLLQEADLYQRHGDTKTALEYYQRAEQFKPKFSQTPQVMKDPRTGNLVNVILGEDGSHRIVPLGVKPDWTIQDLGGTVKAFDRNEIPQGGQTFGKTPTFADRNSAQSNSIAARNAQLAERRLQLEENSPTYMQTEDGIVALPKRPAPGTPLQGQPVTAPDGQPLTKPLKLIPAPVNDAILTNRRALEQIDRAIALAEGKNIGDPKKGGMQGDRNATGWRGVLPEPLLNLADPSGVDVRAEIGDIGSLKIHERSGAASSVQEMQRIRPFVPSALDSNETVLKKLRRLRMEVESEAGGLASTYSREQGYRPNPAAQRNPQPQAAEALQLPANPTSSNLQKGKTYTLPNGKPATWDGFQFKAAK